MLKIPEAVKEIISKNPFLRLGIAYKLFNLSKLARHIKPLVGAKTKKEIKESAVLMALARLQKEKSIKILKTDEFVFFNLIVHSNLCAVVFLQSQEVLEKIGSVYQEIRKRNGYVNLIQGVNEIAITVDEKLFPLIKNIITEKPKNIQKNLSAIGIQFDRKYYKIPGAIYNVIQQITLQEINIFDISSTFTELIIYIDQKDTRLIFDTLYNCFSAKK